MPRRELDLAELAGSIVGDSLREPLATEAWYAKKREDTRADLKRHFGLIDPTLPSDFLQQQQSILGGLIAPHLLDRDSFAPWTSIIAPLRANMESISAVLQRVGISQTASWLNKRFAETAAALERTGNAELPHAPSMPIAPRMKIL